MYILEISSDFFHTLHVMDSENKYRNFSKRVSLFDGTSFKMERLPLVLGNDNHDSLPILTEIFQDAFWRNIYPDNVAFNYQKLKVDKEYENLRASGLETVKILEFLEDQKDDIIKVEEEIMRSHAVAIIEKEKNSKFFEELRLKRFSLFAKLSQHAIQTYEMLQTIDLYPNRIEQYLDFTFNPFLHTCIHHKVPEKQVLTDKKEKKIRSHTSSEVSLTFKAEPSHINFHNFHLNRSYKQKFKLRNIMKQPQTFKFYDLPKTSPFKLKMLTDSYRLAPGMCAEFSVTFQPESLQNHAEVIKFKTVKGADLNVILSNSRDAPRLICYVLNPFLPWDTVKKPEPGSKYFDQKRQAALNFTIDCGTCLLGNYSLVSIVMTNQGEKGKFVVTTENEWVFSEFNEGSIRLCELTQGCFSIFPVYFELEKGGIGEIFVLFTPEREGVFTEKFYVICDNLSHQEIEILGDCVIFSEQFLKVNMYILENTFVYNNRLLTITLTPNKTVPFIFSIINNSPIHFTYFWALKTYTEELQFRKMNPDWINILYSTKYLPSFSKTDVVIELTTKTIHEGIYYIFISLYLKDIPLKCMPEKERKNHSNILKFIDFSIFELEIVCTVAIPPEIVFPVMSSQLINEEVIIDRQVCKLSKSFLNFGVLPKGITVSKCLSIENMTDDEINWKLVEIHFNLNQICESKKIGNLENCQGTLKKNSKIKFAYTVEATRKVRWVSVLLLFSCAECTCQDYTVEDVCLVTYEVADTQINIYTDNKMAVLCPKSFIYVGNPSIQTIHVHNSGVTIGCFYFLNCRGVEAERVRLKFQPQSGVVPAGGTVEVKVELTGLENGIFENIFVPCFTGDPDKLIGLRVVCKVVTINVYVYLPNWDGTYSKFLWPPKTEAPQWDFPEPGEDQQRLPLPECSNESRESLLLDESLIGIVGADSVATTYPTIKIRGVHVKKACKITFYIENVTPVYGQFSVDPTNYNPHSECLNHILVKAKTRTAEFFWEKVCLDGYGIVIEPGRYSGDIIPYEVVEIDLWIYANTYGKYLEEVIVEINDLTPFCFNLLIEVVGLPIEFPFARNTILPCPTIRFENLAYGSGRTSKSFTVTNISSIPLQINWSLFNQDMPITSPVVPFNFFFGFHDDNINLVIPQKFYGCDSCRQCIDVTPSYFVLDKQTTATVTVTVTPSGYQRDYDKTYLKYKLLGFIDIKDEDQFKESYYKRGSGVDFNPAKVMVLVTLEMPVMIVDVSSEDTTMNIFVNNILIDHQKFPEVYMILRNNDICPIRFSMEIDKPFSIIEARTIPTGITDCKNLELRRYESLQVMISCHFSHSELLAYAELLYKRDVEEIELNQEFVSVIRKNLNIYQVGSPRQIIPFQIRLHYPHITVKPRFLAFGHCLIYHTKKTSFTIYNLTGSVVKFEIYKTTKSDVFETRPNYGNIEKNTGVNKQFIDVAVYFTPRLCKVYLEKLRIATNIPYYYIDIPVRGYGSNDEKFIV